MVIIQLAGGLGNQLQQYALYRKFIQLGTEARLDTSWFQEKMDERNAQRDNGTSRELELANFDGLTYKICTEEEREKLTGKNNIWGKIQRKLLPSFVYWFHESQMYHPEIFQFKNMYLSGYFACEKYYSDILDDLRKSIRFPKSQNPANQQMAEEISSCRSVSMHIRRGDYLKRENAEMFGGICTDAYYETSIRKIKEEEPEAHFYLFSDDVDYAKQKYAGPEYTVVDINHGKDSYFDMWLMSRCRHNICANSTFSFWGARLNGNDGKIMIRPTIHKNSQTFVKAEMEELWKGWKFVSPTGRLE